MFTSGDLLEAGRGLVTGIERPDRSAEDVDTVRTLCELALASDWNAEQRALVDLFAKRIDISGALYAAYSSSGRRKSKVKITDPRVLDLVGVMICRALVEETERRPNEDTAILKRLNTLYKARDLAPTGSLAPESEFGREIDLLWKGTLDRLPNEDGIEDAHPAGRDRTSDGTTTLPITVLFYEGPIARAYLETMRAMGFRAQKLIHLIASNDISTGRRVGRWLPKGLRAPYAHRIQCDRIHHWPKRIAKGQPALQRAIIGAVSRQLGFSVATVEAANALRDLASYADVVESVLVEGLRDELLLTRLRAQPESVILFTGGGIVPENLLSISQLRWIHIHPGYLPAIRGADCVLWSTLLTGHPSATCFYMAPGIDTGEIILSCWLPRLSFDGTPLAGIDAQTRYRAIYGFLDPWVRSFVLREMLASHTRFDDLPATPQDLDAGTTYHFMHANVRNVALHRLLSG